MKSWTYYTGEGYYECKDGLTSEGKSRIDCTGEGCHSLTVQAN